MYTVGIRELKNEASGILRAVREEHAEYIITHHGRPVAVILPVEDTERDLATESIVAAAREREDFWARMEALRAEIDANWRSDKSAVELITEQRR